MDGPVIVSPRPNRILYGGAVFGPSIVRHLAVALHQFFRNISRNFYGLAVKRLSRGLALKRTAYTL
jgi:hypothetical protein